jgi:ABC-type Zn uptake system ZnuABC Zn-binding protein ZnuA
MAPLYSFVKAVGGDGVAVKCLCVTTGPHHYQAESQDHRLLRKADLFFAVGLELDNSFADRLAKGSGNSALRYVQFGKRLPADLLLKTHAHDGDEPGHKHEHEHGHGHEHGEYDPHLWLGTEQVMAMVGVIRDELARADPPRGDVYRENAAAYLEALKGLRAEGRKGFAAKKNTRIISFHDSLGYFARSFGLEVAGVIELSPGDEPDAGHLGRIVRLCRDKDRPVAAIAVEPQFPRGTVQAVQRELESKKAPVPPEVEIDPLETADPKELGKEGAGWYEARVRRNLRALAEVLP